MNDRPLEALVNLSRTSARQLGEVGIATEADLRALGAPAAFARLRQHFGRAINFNYLYALDGALKGVRWDLMPEAERETLRVEAQRAAAPPPEAEVSARASRRKKG